MNWLKARLNEPTTHIALSILVKLLLAKVPAEYQIYVDLLCSVLAGVGFVLPEGVKAKVEAAAK